MFFSWKMPGMQEIIKNLLKSTPSLCFIHTHQNKSCAQGQWQWGSIPTTVGGHCKVTWPKAWARSPMTDEETIGAVMLTFIWLLRHLTPGFLPASLGIPAMFLLWVLLFPVFIQAFSTGNSQGCFLCVLLYLLISPCSSHGRLMALCAKGLHVSISSQFWAPDAWISTDAQQTS